MAKQTAAIGPKVVGHAIYAKSHTWLSSQATIKYIKTWKPAFN